MGGFESLLTKPPVDMIFGPRGLLCALQTLREGPLTAVLSGRLLGRGQLPRLLPGAPAADRRGQHAAAGAAQRLARLQEVRLLRGVLRHGGPQLTR